MFPPLLQRVPANFRVRACTDWLAECYEYLPKWTIPDLPEGNPAIIEIYAFSCGALAPPRRGTAKPTRISPQGSGNHFKHRVCWRKQSIWQALICPPILDESSGGWDESRIAVKRRAGRVRGESAFVSFSTSQLADLHCGMTCRTTMDR